MQVMIKSLPGSSGHDTYYEKSLANQANLTISSTDFFTGEICIVFLSWLNGMIFCKQTHSGYIREVTLSACDTMSDCPQ